jgi:hypothetical protein
MVKYLVIAHKPQPLIGEGMLVGESERVSIDQDISNTRERAQEPSIASILLTAC